MQLDELDKKLIYELGRNARQSYRELAKRLHSKKDVIAYRMNALIDKEVIWKFVPIIAVNWLGLLACKTYFKFHGMTKSVEEEMMRDLLNDRTVSWIAPCTGAWDLFISTWTTTMFDYVKRKNTFFSKYGRYVEEYALTMNEDVLVFNRDHFLQQKNNDRKNVSFGGEMRKEHITETEKKILFLIMNDGRYKAQELATTLKLNPKTVISHIRALENRGIIQGYTVFLNRATIGLTLVKLCVYLHDYSNAAVTKVLGFVGTRPEVVHVVKAIGSWELEFELEVQDSNVVYLFVRELRNQFPKIIKRVDVANIIAEPKLSLFPEQEY